MHCKLTLPPESGGRCSFAPERHIQVRRISASDESGLPAKFVVVDMYPICIDSEQFDVIETLSFYFKEETWTSKSASQLRAMMIQSLEREIALLKELTELTLIAE